MDAAPALTEGIASIEPASGAESATAARSSLLEPGAGGKMVQATARWGQSRSRHAACKGAQRGTRRCDESTGAKIMSHSLRRSHQGRARTQGVSAGKLEQRTMQLWPQGAVIERAHKGIRMRVPWPLGILEGCHQLERRSLSRQGGPLRPAKTSAGSVTRQQDKPGCKVSRKAAPSMRKQPRTLSDAPTIPSHSRRANLFFS